MARIPEAPPPGVARGATPDAVPNRWWDMNMMRWRGGVLQPIGGNVGLTGTAVSDLPRDLITWHDNSYTRWAAYGTDSRLYAYNFQDLAQYDITPAGVGGLEPPGARVGYGLADYGESTYGTARDPADVGPQDVSATMGDKWSMDTFGELLLVVPTQSGKLYVWDPNTPATPAVVVPEAPIDNRGVAVTDQRSVVLIGAGGDPRMVAWSDMENIHMWTPDVTNLAGSQRVSTQAYIMTALKVPQGVLIYTSNDLHLMAYAGMPYAYGITQIAASCGPLSHRAPVAIGGFAAWPSLQGFWTYNGNAQPLLCDVSDWFYSLLNRTMVGRVFGSPNPPFSELWWDWPDEGSSESNRYIALNYNPQAANVRPWLIGVRARTAGDLMGTMDHPILGGPTASGGGLYMHEYGWLDDGVSRAPNGLIYAESASIALGEGDNRFHVKQIALDGASAGAVGGLPVFGYRFLVKEQPHDPIEYDTGLYTLAHDGLMDVRFSGRVVRMRIEALRDEPFGMGRPRLEIRQGGRR